MEGDAVGSFAARFNRLCSQYVRGANFVSSPFSVELCLAVLHGGAAGSTAEQIGRALGIAADAESYYRRCHQALVNATNRSGVTIKVSTSLYVAQQLNILADFHRFVAGKFLTQVERINFSNSAGASSLINGNVEKVTCGKIKNLVDPSSLNDQTKAVLVNAIYFKGNWKKKFDPANTKACDFYLDSTRKLKTQMMMMDGEDFLAGSNDELACRAIELPYVGGSYRMLVLLPHDRDGVDQLEKKLGDYPLHEVRGTLSLRRCLLWLPRFTIEAEFDLEPVLTSAGVEHLFVGGLCDLSGVTGSRDVVVSRAIHKAFIEVNEEGTEAAAATAVLMMRCSLPLDPPPFEFRADHPFLFFIIDEESGLVHFSGKYAGPQV